PISTGRGASHGRQTGVNKGPRKRGPFSFQMADPKYKRILLKLSGEALAGEQKFGIEPKVIKDIAGQVKDVHELGVEIAIVIGGGGTGNPYFSTDTAAALRAMEIHADAIFKATTVDGVYDKDPKKFPDAKKFSSLSYIDVLNKNLKVMDSTAISLCMDNKLPIIVFDLGVRGNILRVVRGEEVGTTVGTLKPRAA